MGAIIELKEIRKNLIKSVVGRRPKGRKATAQYLRGDEWKVKLKNQDLRNGKYSQTKSEA